MTRRAPALFCTIAVLLLLAGCTQDGGIERADASSPDTTTGSSPTAGSEPTNAGLQAIEGQTLSATTTPQSGEESSPSNLVPVDVRVGLVEGHERIVLEFSGTGTPGWVVHYVDRPVLDGSGEVVDLDGRATLDIYASATTWPAPDYYDGPSHFTPRNGGDVTDIFFGGSFEGTTQVLAGIDGGRVPFRVFTLTAPSRLVIDLGTNGDEKAD